MQVMAERVFRAIGKPEMIDDPRFRTNTDRVRNIDECDGAVADFIAARTLAESMAIFEKAEVTANPVYEIDQMLDDPHVQERGVIVEAPDEEAGSVLMHNVIPRLSETPGRLRYPAPGLGQDTREILECDRRRCGADRCAGGGGCHQGRLTRRQPHLSWRAKARYPRFRPAGEQVDARPECHCEERSDEAIPVERTHENLERSPDRDCFVATLLAMTGVAMTRGARCDIVP